MHTAAW